MDDGITGPGGINKNNNIIMSEEATKRIEEDFIEEMELQEFRVKTCPVCKENMVVQEVRFETKQDGPVFYDRHVCVGCDYVSKDLIFPKKEHKKQ